MADVSIPNTAMTPAKLFESKVFRIPDYQRGYAWEKLQRDEFLEDLELLAPGAIHYTGTIVLSPSVQNPLVKDRRGKTYQAFDVVDGQQRLTTIVLLLDAIRRQLKSLEQGLLADGLTETYLILVDRNDSPIAKLTLNADSHDFYFSNVIGDKPSLDGPKIRSHRNLRDAKTQFAEYLQGQRSRLGEKFPMWLEDLRDKVCEQLALSVYHVQRAADAGVIFEVMNNRGKPITELEKAKNYLLYLAGKLDLPDPQNLGDQINTTWAHIFQQLMANGLPDVSHEDQLLRSHWLMSHDYQERNWDGSKSLKARFHLRDYIGRHDRLLADLAEYVQSMRNAATAYCDVANPRHPTAFRDFKDDEKTRKQVVSKASQLSRLRTTAPFLPLLMAMRLKYAGNPEAYLKIVDLCEKFAFRVYRFLSRRPTAGRSSLFLLANAVYTGRFSIEETAVLLIGFINKYSPNSDMEAEYRLLDTDNDWYDWRGISYFLYEYESHLCAERNKNLAINWAHLEKDDAKQHTIEHILPRSPATGYWTEHFDPALRRKLTHDIGNLCLTLDNSSYGRKPFPEKKGESGSGKRCYANGDLVMERDLAAFGDWDEKAVLQRRGANLEWARRRWGVPIVTTDSPEADADVSDEETDLDVPVESEQQEK